eukprot:438741-Alexandrium_andersonii.AAC.1
MGAPTSLELGLGRRLVHVCGTLGPQPPAAGVLGLCMGFETATQPWRARAISRGLEELHRALDSPEKALEASR